MEVSLTLFRSSLVMGIVATMSWLASACAGPCDTSFVPSLIVEVRDSVTGAAAAAGATGRAIEGSFVAVLEAHDVDPDGVPLSLIMPSERPGTYTVQVTKPGYSLWERRKVQIDDLGCNAEQAQLKAKLQAAT
jgi:hypothetical protein